MQLHFYLHKFGQSDEKPSTSSGINVKLQAAVHVQRFRVDLDAMALWALLLPF